MDFNRAHGLLTDVAYEETGLLDIVCECDRTVLTRIAFLPRISVVDSDLLGSVNFWGCSDPDSKSDSTFRNK
jgi:hypothetical protein